MDFFTEKMAPLKSAIILMARLSMKNSIQLESISEETKEASGNFGKH